MAAGYETRTDSWAYKITGVISAGYSAGGTIVGMDLYSDSTGFLGHARFYGVGIDLGAAVGSTLTDWKWMDVSHAFSPHDLHGARGSVKAASAGIIVGSTHMFATAHMKKSPDYLFDDAWVGSAGGGLGFSLGYCWGTWYITAVWSEAPPAIWN